MRSGVARLAWPLVVGVLALLLLVPARPAAALEDSDTLDLDKAVKIGSGPKMVIEFTDPDCPFCLKAEAWLSRRPDITRYIFFYPLKSHPDAQAKVQYILSVDDKPKAYRETLAGTFGQKQLDEITRDGIRLQQEHHDIARANNVNATPIFIIAGRIVRGFDVRLLEQLLK